MTTTIDRLDVLVSVGLGLVCYGVGQLHSLAAAAIVAGAGLLVLAAVGVAWQIRSVRKPL